MKAHFILLSVALSAFLTSCTVLKTNTAKTMDIYGSGVIQKPVVVDLDVKEAKVTGTSTETQGKAIDMIKQEAVADAIKKASADILVEPTFETITSNGKITVTVTGFPGTYKNFRIIKDTNDVKLLKAGIIHKAEVYEPTKVSPKKNPKAAIIGTVTGLLLMFVILGAAGVL